MTRGRRSQRPKDGRRLTTARIAGFTVGVVATSMILFTGNRTISPETASCPAGNQLTIATGSDVSAGSFRRDLIKQWNLRPGRKIEARLIELSDSTDEARAQMVAAAQSRSCAYDVLVLDVAWVPEFARNGYLQTIPLTEDQKSSFVEAPLQTGEIDGERYAIPFATDAPLLFRHDDLYSPGTPMPSTWELLMAEAKEKGGYVGQLGDYEGGSVNLLEMILSGGGKVVDGDRVVLNTPENAEKVRQSLTEWQTMVTAPDAENLREESSLQTFLSRKVAYMRNWPFAFHRLASDPSMRNADGTLGFSIAPLPGNGADKGPGILGGYDLAIAEGSSLSGDARALINFLTTDDAQKKLFACGGYAPVLKSVYDFYRETPKTDQDTPKTCGDLLSSGAASASGTPAEELEITADQLRTFAKAISLAVEKAEIRPVSANYAAFSEVFRSCARQVVIAGMPPPTPNPDRTTKTPASPPTPNDTAKTPTPPLDLDLDLDYYASTLQNVLAGRQPPENSCYPPPK